MIADLKRIYLFLVREVLAGVPQDRMFEAENQQFMASLADVAIETYTAESVVLRVLKGGAAGGDGGFYDDLAAIYLARAADRTRQEAAEILGALHDGDALAERLERVQGWLPLPSGLIETRSRVAGVVLENEGLPASS